MLRMLPYLGAIVISATGSGSCFYAPYIGIYIAPFDMDEEESDRVRAHCNYKSIVPNAHKRWAVFDFRKIYGSCDSSLRIFATHPHLGRKNSAQYLGIMENNKARNSANSSLTHLYIR